MIQYGNAPGTLAILTAVGDALQSVPFNGVTGGPQGGPYTTGPTSLVRVVSGGLKDYTDSIPLGVVKLLTGPTERHAMGGVVWNRPMVTVRLAVGMTDAIAAEVNIAAIYDAYVPYFHTHATLGNADEVFHSVIDGNSVRFGYTSVNRIEYRVLEFELQVSQAYAVTGGFQP
ncbi:MAG TPA: hypothetical protein VH593_04685 [Ktedonobacteraceae bacterium]